MPEHKLDFAKDVRYLERNAVHHKIVLTQEAAKRLADLLGIDLGGREMHLITVERDGGGMKQEVVSALPAPRDPQAPEGPEGPPTGIPR